MSKSPYVDTPSTLQVIGSLFKQPNLIDRVTDQFIFSSRDFPNDFHRIVFGAIYNLHQMGMDHIKVTDIENYLENYPTDFATYKANDGSKWLISTTDAADPANFDYYCSRIKKMTLLREYAAIGLDVSFIYDPNNLLEPEKRRKQEKQLEELTLDQLADIIDDRIETIRRDVVDDFAEDSVAIGEVIEDVFMELKEEPEIGIPLYGRYVNTVTRGARLKKLYLRSAPSGLGKTRSMIADACYIACDKIYSTQDERWIDNGISLPTLFISTEMEIKELVTMAVAFLSGVDEGKILLNNLEFDERERVNIAIQVLKESPLFIEELPDFNLKDVENTIKKNIRMHETQYIFFDYLHTSIKILEEISTRSKGVKLREDNILFLFSVNLKNLCNQFNIFIMSATQLNADYKTSETPDQNLLRGAKSIADKIDYGSIILEVTKRDQENIESLIEEHNLPMPNAKLSIYKNRGNRYNKCYLWMNADRGTCRFEPLFCTTFDYVYIPINETNVISQQRDD